MAIGRTRTHRAHPVSLSRVVGALVALLLTMSLAGAWAPAALAAGGSISGTVTSTGGTPLSGITAQAGTISAGGFTAVGSSVTTAGNGTYTISVAATGRYAVRFIDPTQVHAAGYYSSSGLVPDAPSATLVRVAGAVTGVNVALPATHGISGTVTGIANAPVANVTVDAITTSGAVVAQKVPPAKTSASGTYTIKLASGSYKLRFTPPGTTYPTVYYTTTGVTTDLSAASTLVLGSTDLTGKNVQLPAARLIQGTITNASAVAVAGLKVTAGLASTTTDGTGHYSLLVPPGQHVLKVLDQTDALPSGYFHAPSGLTTDPAAATKVDVTAANATANVQLSAGTTVSGAVTTEAGAPLANMDIWLTPVGAVDPLAIVTTSGSGTYSIVAAPGSFIVKVMDPAGRYTSGFYRENVTGGFTKDQSVATHVSVTASPVALHPIKVPLYNTVDRQSGANRYATAANISRGTVPSGVDVVYIATGLNFPDALAAAAAAGHLGGPVLLVTPTSIPDVVKTELTRLKPKKIIIAGGTSVVSSSVASQLDPYTAGPVLRQSGANRYATAAAISTATFGVGAPVAYVATGLNFPDALAAAAVAGRLGGPVLLVQPGIIPDVVKTELTRLRPAKIVIAGGTGVVSSSVQTQLDAYTTGPVVRQSGASRYATAAAISAATFAPGAPVAYVATGLNFPDALAAAAAAARLGGPVLLVQQSAIPAEAKTELTRLQAA
ncbi:MAG TPA: cell wall-binding repeat-containing protein, partial [Candidatus Limnocylindrales bacterium]